MNETNEKEPQLVCPNCGSEQIHWISYPKIPFGSLFVLWLLISLLTVKGTILVFAIGAVYWVIALIIRLRQNYRASLVNRMHCERCGIIFEIPKDAFRKGGSDNDR